LACALAVFCDKEIDCKNISFSLDPLVPSNPEGPFQKKVVWPDNELSGHELLAGTEFAEIMFEADWIMKQLSLGIDV
jgi:hypothetical protein